MFERLLLVSTILGLTACSVLPINNDKIMPENTPEDKIITIVQEDKIVKVNKFNSDVIWTKLTIDGDEIKPFLKKRTVVRRYPSPKSILITCKHSTGYNYIVTQWKVHSFNEPLEEGKTYTFICQDLDSYKVTVGDFSELKQ